MAWGTGWTLQDPLTLLHEIFTIRPVFRRSRSVTWSSSQRHRGAAGNEERKTDMRFDHLTRARSLSALAMATALVAAPLAASAAPAS